MYDVDGAPEQSVYVDMSEQPKFNISAKPSKSFPAKEMRGQRHRKTRGPGADKRRADDLGDGAEDQGSTAPVETQLQQGALGLTLTLSPGSPSPPTGPTSIQQSPSTSCYYIAAKKKTFFKYHNYFVYFKKTIYKILQSPTSLRLLDHSNRLSLCSGVLEGGKLMGDVVQGQFCETPSNVKVLKSVN